MQAYRTHAPAVYPAYLALAHVVALESRGANDSAADVAATLGCSRATLYNHRAAALRGLQPTPPGPPAPDPVACRLADLERAHATALERVASLEAQLRHSVPFDLRTQRAMELVLTVEDVSLRGIQRVVTLLTGGPPPRLADLQQRIKKAGRAAGRLLTKARAQVANQLAAVMGDDIFFAGTPVKVVAEPRSNALLNVGRWRWHKAEDWALWLEEYGGLRLFISDLGTDIRDAVRARNIAQEADFFHEERWWLRDVLVPIEKEYIVAMKAVNAEWKWIGECVGNPGTRVERSLLANEKSAARWEARYYTAYGALQEVRWLYQPVDVQGQLWTEASIDATLARIDTALATLRTSAGEKARSHVASHGHRYAAHHVLLDAIVVVRSPGATWSEHETRQHLYDLRMKEHQLEETTTEPEWTQRAKAIDDLLHQIRGQCTNWEEVEHAIARHCTWMPRSSSAVESLNSQLRVLQMKHRTVSDELLWLVALAWNLTPRSEGRRKNRSPYAMLGVDVGQGDRPFYEVLLDELAREERAN